MPEKTQPMGLQLASRATGMPLKPVAGRLMEVCQENSTSPWR